MRYDNFPAFEKYFEEKTSSQLSSLYFILGKEAYECQEAIQLMLRFLLPSQAEREFALTVFEGSSLEEYVLSEALASAGSFFAKSQVIWIQQAEKLKKGVQDILVKSFSRLQTAQFLILSGTSWQKNTSFYKAIDKEGVILDFAEVKSWEKEKRLAEWVNKQSAAARKLMSFQVCQLLVKRIGPDQALLAREIEKLVCYCSDKKEIAKEDVEALCPHLHNESIWHLGEAIFRRDSANALQAAHGMLMEGQPLLPLLRQIRSQFQTEYQICLLLTQGKQPHEITQEFPYMKGQILERHLQQARQYGLKAFKAGFLALETAEMRIKNSSIDEKIILELLMVQLTSQPS